MESRPENMKVSAGFDILMGGAPSKTPIQSNGHSNGVPRKNSIKTNGHVQPRLPANPTSSSTGQQPVRSADSKTFDLFKPSPAKQAQYVPVDNYSVTFKIGYKTDFGQSLCVVGSTSELGNWKQFRAHMKWTDGHVWTLCDVPIRNVQHFQYKYVVLKDGKPDRWE